MNRYREQVRTAVQATVVHSSTAYSWFGQRSERLPTPVRRALTPQTARSYLHYALQTRLYNDFYSTGRAQSQSRAEAAGSPPGRTPFVEALSAANAGTGYWTPGWEVTATATAGVLVRKGGLQLLARSGEHRPAEPVQPGTLLSLRFPKEFLDLSPGFYMALGEQELPSTREQGIVRWYWNLTAAGAIRFLAKATRELNQAGLPFKLKVLNDPARYVRCDAAVLYVHKPDCGAVSRVLGGIHPELAPALKPSTPALTKAVAPGVGVAEDPGRGESFGLHRCGLLAEGLIQAHEQGRRALSDRLEAVEESFAAEGLSLSRPYLNPGSKDEYRLVSGRRAASHSSGSPPEEADAESFLEAADEIGRRLTADATWHRRRCNWLGAEPEPEHAGSAFTRTAYRALGPELYGGSSGVALFLAQLQAATGDRTQKETALGALRHSFSHLGGVPLAVRFGLYSGWSGIALAAARIGALLGEEEWPARARRLLARLGREGTYPREFDFLSGTAGAVAALLALQDELGEASLLELAVRLGDDLLEGAEPTAHGCCWKSVSYPENPGLTGFSHGASGVGHALFQLFRATGEQRYRRTAEGAFDYERHWYDAQVRNWPDLRVSQGGRPDARSALSFSTAWCHGAPGIALARLRAYALFGNKQDEDEAVVALDTTSRAVQAGLSSEAENYSLCHGMAGNADVLLQGARMLGKARAGDAALARRVGTLGIHRYARQGHLWPCGTRGDTPSLMLGLAGIGYFYLRLADPAVPCILEVSADHDPRTQGS